MMSTKEMNKMLTFPMTAAQFGNIFPPVHQNTRDMLHTDVNEMKLFDQSMP